MKLNKPYLESFLSAEALTLKYSRIRQSKSLEIIVRANNQGQESVVVP